MFSHLRQPSHFGIILMNLPVSKNLPIRPTSRQQKRLEKARPATIGWQFHCTTSLRHAPMWTLQIGARWCHLVQRRPPSYSAPTWTRFSANSICCATNPQSPLQHHHQHPTYLAGTTSNKYSLRTAWAPCLHMHLCSIFTSC